MLVGAGAPPSPSGVVAVQAPGPVHRLGPVERPPRHRRFEVDVVLGERAALLRQVPPDPPGRGVPRYRLEHGHAPHLPSPARTLPESSTTVRLSNSTPGCISAKLALRPGELLDHLRGLHVVRPQIVRDGVERVDRLVVVVPPTRHLAGEPSRRRAVDHDEPRPASHFLRRQLQEDSDEVGDRHAEFAGETFSGLHLPVGHAHVKLLRVPFHLPARLLEPRNRGRADARGARGIPRMERSRAAGGLRSRRPGSGRSVPKEGTRPGPPPRASGPAPGGAAKSYSGGCVHGIGLLLCSGSVRISRPAQRVEGFESFPENAIGLQRRYERGVQVGSPID